MRTTCVFRLQRRMLREGHNAQIAGFASRSDRGDRGLRSSVRCRFDRYADGIAQFGRRGFKGDFGARRFYRSRNFDGLRQRRQCGRVHENGRF